MIDFHFHVEEGPYTFRWLERTAQALDCPGGTSKETFGQTLRALHERWEAGCYSELWFDQYLAVAKSRGMKEVGIVDHLYRFREARAYFERTLDLTSPTIGSMQRVWLDSVMSESLGEYVEAVRRAQAKWAKEGVMLRLGVEVDYFMDEEESLRDLLSQHSWDFVIGSVHFWRGWGFDNPETANRFNELSLDIVYEEVADVIEAAARSQIFSFIAHVDNLKVFGQRPNEAVLHRFYERVAHSLAQNDVASEWNAGLYYRYPVKEACPSDALLSYFSTHGVPLTVSSDAHFPDDLGRYTDYGLEVLKEAGYESVATFQSMNRVMKAIDKI